MSVCKEYKPNPEGLRSMRFCLRAVGLLFAFVLVLNPLLYVISHYFFDIGYDATFGKLLLGEAIGILMLLPLIIMFWLGPQLLHTGVRIGAGKVWVEEWYGKKWSFDLCEPIIVTDQIPGLRRIFRPSETYMLKSGPHATYIYFPEGSDVENEVKELE